MSSTEDVRIGGKKRVHSGEVDREEEEKGYEADGEYIVDFSICCPSCSYDFQEAELMKVMDQLFEEDMEVD